MFLAENLKNTANCEHRIWTNQMQNGLSPNPYTNKKRDNYFGFKRMSYLFFIGEVFAVAKVKLLCSEVCATHK